MQVLPTRHILLLADSRGYDFERFLNNALYQMGHRNIIVTVKAVGGARFHTLYEELHTEIQNGRTYSLVMVMAGVCYLTNKHLNGMVTPIYTEVGQLLEVMTDRLHKLYNEVTGLGHRIVFCEMVGLDINVYNGTVGCYNIQQEVINQGLPHLNNIIVCLNEEHGLITPWLQKTVHPLKNDGSRGTKYQRLRDGLHLLTTTADYWIGFLAHACVANIDKLTLNGAFD